MDGGYEAWVRSIMAEVEAAGATDAKHGTRLRLENYAFLQLGLQVRLHSAQCLFSSAAVAQLGPRYELTAYELCAASLSWLLDAPRLSALPCACVPPHTLTRQALPLDRTHVLSAFAGQVAAAKDRAMAGYIEQQVGPKLGSEGHAAGWRTGAGLLGASAV